MSPQPERSPSEANGEARAVGMGPRGNDPMPRLKLPWISIVLMAIFLVGGSLALLVDWPPGPANLDWGIWIVVYFGYAYVIGAAIFYVKTGK